MLSGNTSEAGDSCGGPDESFLFLLTSDTDPGIGLPGDGVGGLGKAADFWPLRCALDAP
jgi:hypothetical protein